MGKKSGLLTCLICLSVCFTHCSTENAIKKADVEQWKSLLLKERAEKDTEFKNSPESPMAGTHRYNLFKDHPYFIDLKDDGLSVSDSMTDVSAFSIQFKDNDWQFITLKDINPVDSKNQIIESGPIRESMLFSLGRLSFRVYPSVKKLVIIVFDSQREMLSHFEGLVYYDPAPSFAVNASVVKTADGNAIKMLTSQNEEKTYYRHAFLDFKIKGKQYRLTVFRNSKNPSETQYLFLPFRDLTSGEETYGAARYIDLKMPLGDTILLDFNTAYNPLCNYSKGYNCPMAPAENVLDVAIRAGEKEYPH